MRGGRKVGRKLSKREKWVVVGALLVIIGFFLPWWKAGTMNPATRIPYPPRFGWSNTSAWLALVDAILLVALLEMEAIGKQVFVRYAIGAALGALCMYIGLMKMTGIVGGTAAMWWPAFLIAIAVVAAGLAPEESMPQQARVYLYLVGMAVVVGLSVGIALKAFTYGPILLIIGGFVGYLVNVGYAKEHYPEYRRLREEDGAR
jgi:hypothetical protein